MATGVLLSEEAAEDITKCVMDFKRRGPWKQPPPPPRTADSFRYPIRGILLEDLVDGGVADCAVTELISTAEIQQLEIVGQISGGVNGGIFTLQFKGQTTAAIPWNATAVQLQAALEALTTIGKGNVAVSLGQGNYTNTEPGAVATAEFPGVWLIEFKGTFVAGQNPPPIPLLVPNSSITGGPSLMISETTHWRDTGVVEQVVCTIPVGTPTPMHAGAVVGCIWFPGVGYGFPGVEPRQFTTNY